MKPSLLQGRAKKKEPATTKKKQTKLPWDPAAGSSRTRRAGGCSWLRAGDGDPLRLGSGNTLLPNVDKKETPCSRMKSLCCTAKATLGPTVAKDNGDSFSLGVKSPKCLR